MPDPVAARLRLAPEALTRRFSAEQFAFSTTDDLEPFRGVLGQERAVEALQFGVAQQVACPGVVSAGIDENLDDGVGLVAQFGDDGVKAVDETCLGHVVSVGSVR